LRSEPIRYLGVIPARRGSKGLARKNMQPLGDRPLVQYTIEAALASAQLSELVITTDDEDVLRLAEKLGCPTPLVRPAGLAEDDTPMIDVVLHAVDHIEGLRAVAVENVVLLQPTSPFRDHDDIDGAIEQFSSSGRDTLISVSEVSQHPCECVSVVDGSLEWAVPWPAGARRRQDLATYYYVNGATYVAKTTFLREHRLFLDAHSALHVMNAAHGLDIDTKDELMIARGLLELSGRGEPVFSDA
jgi:CMP-N,N'-diacetyllegionaminic acid synthase